MGTKLLLSLNLLFLSLLLLIGVWLYSPAFALITLESAIANKNSLVIEKFIDFPAIRANFKKTLLQTTSMPFLNKSPSAQDYFAEYAKTIDTIVTPDTIKVALNNLEETNQNQYTWDYGNTLDLVLVKPIHNNDSMQPQLILEMKRENLLFWKITAIRY